MYLNETLKFTETSIDYLLRNKQTVGNLILFDPESEKYAVVRQRNYEPSDEYIEIAFCIRRGMWVACDWVGIRKKMSYAYDGSPFTEQQSLQIGMGDEKGSDVTDNIIEDYGYTAGPIWRQLCLFRLSNEAFANAYLPTYSELQDVLDTLTKHSEFQDIIPLENDFYVSSSCGGTYALGITLKDDDTTVVGGRNIVEQTGYSLVLLK